MTKIKTIFEIKNEEIHNKTLYLTETSDLDNNDNLVGDKDLEIHQYSNQDVIVRNDAINLFSEDGIEFTNKIREDDIEKVKKKQMISEIKSKKIEMDYKTLTIDDFLLISKINKSIKNRIGMIMKAMNFIELELITKSPNPELIQKAFEEVKIDKTTLTSANQKGDALYFFDLTDEGQAILGVKNSNETYNLPMDYFICDLEEIEGEINFAVGCAYTEILNDYIDEEQDKQQNKTDLF